MDLHGNSGLKNSKISGLRPEKDCCVFLSDSRLTLCLIRVHPRPIYTFSSRRLLKNLSVSVSVGPWLKTYRRFKVCTFMISVGWLICSSAQLTPFAPLDSHSAGCSVMGRLTKRHSSHLTPRVQGKAPWLHGNYPASSLLWASPTPDTAICRLLIPNKCWRHGLHRAGSPRFLDATVQARPPLSPRGALQLLSLVASPQMAGFTISGRLAAPICVTRPNRVHLR